MSLASKAREDNKCSLPVRSTAQDIGLEMVGRDKVSGKMKWIPWYQKSSQDLFKDHIKIDMLGSTSPINTDIASNTAGYSNVKFTFKPSGESRVLGMKLHFSFQETASASVNLSAIMFLIAKLRLMTLGNGVDTAVQTHYAESLYADLGLYVNNQEFIKACPWMGLSSAYSVSTSGNSSMNMSSAGWQQVYVPIFGVFDILQPVLSALKEEISLVFDFQSIKVSGSGTPTLKAMNLVFDHAHISAADKQTMANIYNNDMVEIHYLDNMKLQYQSQTVTASTALNLSLKPLKDLKAAMFLVYARSGTVSAANSNNLMNFVSFGTQNVQTQSNFKIQKSSDVDVLAHGNGLYLSDIAQYNAKYFGDNSFFLESKNIYPIVCCKNVKAALSGNESAGHLYMPWDNTDFVFTPDANTSGTWYIEVIAKYWRTLTVENGKIKARNY